MGGWLDKAEGVIFTNWQIGKFKKVGVSVFGQDYGLVMIQYTLVETNIDTTKKDYLFKRMFLLA